MTSCGCAGGLALNLLSDVTYLETRASVCVSLYFIRMYMSA